MKVHSKMIKKMVMENLKNSQANMKEILKMIKNMELVFKKLLIIFIKGNSKKI